MPNPLYVVFDPEDHYWFVGVDQTRVYSSKRGIYVALMDSQYLTWLTGNVMTMKVETETELWSILTTLAPSAAMMNPAVLDKLKDSEIIKVGNGVGLGVLAKILLNHENRIRTLESKTPITMAQFKTGIKAII